MKRIKMLAVPCFERVIQEAGKPMLTLISQEDSNEGLLDARVRKDVIGHETKQTSWF
jgi:hypothetical protein